MSEFGNSFKDLNLDRVVEFKMPVTAQFVNDLRHAGFTSILPQSELE